MKKIIIMIFLNIKNSSKIKILEYIYIKIKKQGDKLWAL